MLIDSIQKLFKKNLIEYQKEINIFVLKVCLSGGILAILFFSILKYLSVLNKLEWKNIINFSVISLINLFIPILFYTIFVRKNNSNLSVHIFKYILITCAAVNYYALITNIPYNEMWSSIFLVFFLSSFYLEVNCVVYSIVLALSVCLIAFFTGNQYFIPQNDTYKELLIRCLGFNFGAICSIITAGLSKKLLMRSSKSEFESNQSFNDLDEIVKKATIISHELSQAGLSIAALANQQNEASEEIAQKSSNVSEGATNTAKSVEESSILIDTLVRDTKFNIEKISSLEISSSKLQEVANEGKKSVNEAVQKIEFIKHSVSITSNSAKELNLKAKEIDTVVEFIRQIANQTNLLALNASIEAARAGEHGKGFAVVAFEIRNLAEQSHESLKIISTTLSEILTHSKKVDQLMEESVSAVEEGVEIIQASDSYYQKIIETLSNTINLLSEISKLSEGQLEESRTLHEFIQTVKSTAQITSQSVETVAASTQESFAASEELINSANLINQLSSELLTTVKNT